MPTPSEGAADKTLPDEIDMIRWSPEIFFGTGVAVGPGGVVGASVGGGVAGTAVGV